MSIYTIKPKDSEWWMVESIKEFTENNPIQLQEFGHEKIPAWNKGISPSDETKRLCGLAAKRKVFTDVMRDNYRKSKIGEKNPNFGGKSWTPEAREKLSKTNTGKKNLGLVEWHKNNTCYGKTKVTCPHCNKDGAAIVMQRWHFDNCKSKV